MRKKLFPFVRKKKLSSQSIACWKTTRTIFQFDWQVNTFLFIDIAYQTQSFSRRRQNPFLFDEIISEIEIFLKKMEFSVMAYPWAWTSLFIKSIGNKANFPCEWRKQCAQLSWPPNKKAILRRWMEVEWQTTHEECSDDLRFACCFKQFPYLLANFPFSFVYLWRAEQQKKKTFLRWFFRHL